MSDSALRRRLAKYGMTVEDYELLLEAQNHRCAICTKRFSAARYACVDHSHDTGEVRGLLCSACNVLIGYLHDNAEWLRNAMNHLLSPIAEWVFDKPRRHRDAPPLEAL